MKTLNIDGHTLEQVEERKFILTLDMMGNHPIETIILAKAYLSRAQQAGWLISQTDEQTFELIPPESYAPKQEAEEAEKEHNTIEK